MLIESSKQRKQRLRDERRAREAEEEDERRRKEAHAQSVCGHYQCDVTEWTWEGKPRQVVCRDCGATNYIEDDV